MKKQITILLLLLLTATLLVLSPVEVFSQTTSKMYVVKNSVQFLPGELISKDVRDTNGEVCAGILVKTDLTGLSFKAWNGIVKVNKDPGQALIFVSPTERVLEIYKTGYEPLRVILNNVGINLKSGRTWELTITGDKKLDLIPLTIKTTPKGANIFIDFKLRESGKTLQVSEGKHIIHIEKDGFVPIVDSVDISIDNVYFEYKLVKIELVNVQFNSIPTNAKIIIKDDEKGKTNFVYKILPGKYKIRVSKPGYIDHEEEVTVSPINKNFTFNLIKNQSLLKLNVLPKDAKVELNGKKYLNIDSLELEPGTYKIDISHNDFRTISDSVNLEPGIDTTLEYSMQQKLGGIKFTIEPISANIVMSQNGVTISEWEGNKEISNLPVGEYQLICKVKNYKIEKVDIVIKDNETIIKNINMKFGKSDYAYLNYNRERNYDVYIDGKEKGSTSKHNIPAETGRHTIELRNNEESIKSVVFIDGGNSEITIEREPKTGIILLSALLPGLGQITHGRATMGAIYMGAFAGTAAYHYMNYKSYNDLKGELEVLTIRYNNTTNTTDKYNLAKEVNNKQSETDDAYNKAKTSIWFPIGVYVVSLLDAILYPTPKAIRITDNRTMQIVPNLALSPNGELNAGIFVRF